MKYSTVHYSIVRSDPEDNRIESDNSREQSQPSRQQQHTASPVSCDDSIIPPKSIDVIRDGKEGIPNFHKNIIQLDPEGHRRILSYQELSQPRKVPLSYCLHSER